MTLRPLFLTTLLLTICVSIKAHAQQYRIVNISNGTGFFVSKAGYVLTNAHVVDQCRDAHVSGAGVDAAAEIIEKDRKNDMALLRVRETPRAFATFRSTNLPMHTGDEVVVVGHPLAQKLTTREAQFISSSGPLNEPQWLRFSNSVFQGNSGGPLLDGSGQVIGMIMAKATTYHYNDGRAQNEVVAKADVAIQPYKIAEMLDRYGVELRYGSDSSELAAHRVEDIARNFVVQIKCQIN